jgi:cellulose synthase/poly-beta-1,6-N-acetylglucosamine synthase-like glycosyltransferase
MAVHQPGHSCRGRWNAGDLESWSSERSLRSLQAQTYPVSQCEVIVLVDAAEAEAAGKWIRSLWPLAKIIGVPGSTYYRVKNAALLAAKGDYLVLADSDVAYERVWLSSMLAAFRPGVDLVVETRAVPA